MKTFLSIILLFVSVVVSAQMDVKYIIEKSSTTSELAWVIPEADDEITKQVVRGRTQGREMIAGDIEYWNTTLSSFRDLYFSKEQLALFKEKNYRLRVYLILDNIGNVMCVRFQMSEKMLDVITQK